MTGRYRVEKLTAEHRLQDFDCGVEALNRFLRRHALQSQNAGSSRTYLALQGEDVAGYYSLAVGQLDYADAPERLTKGVAAHPVPVMRLARLAVALGHRGKGLGKGMLKDAFLRTLQAADIAGLRAVIVDAKEDEARRFYEAFDFTPSPTDPYHLVFLLTDAKAILG